MINLTQKGIFKFIFKSPASILTFPYPKKAAIRKQKIDITDTIKSFIFNGSIIDILKFPSQLQTLF